MKLTDTQKEILLNTDGKSKISAYELGQIVRKPSGPTARSAESLVGQGFLKAKSDKEGTRLYTRTAEGSKIAKKL